MTMEEAKAAGYDLIIFPHTTDVENNICVRVHRNTGFEVVIFEEEIAHTLVKVVAIKRTKTTGTAAAVKAQKKFKTNLIIQALRIYKEEIDLAAHAVLSSALKKQWREDSDVIERLIRDFTVDTTELETGILAHLNAGNVINAIKFVREKTNMPLREAKDHVEEIGVKHNLRVYINGAYHWKYSTW